jgi:hypothetical protein
MNFKKYELLSAMFHNDYYSQLMGYYVVGVKNEIDEYSDGVWPILVFSNKEGDVIECTLSRDEEGNGPGFMFGLPINSNNRMEEVNRMTEEEIQARHSLLIQTYDHVAREGEG